MKTYKFLGILLLVGLLVFVSGCTQSEPTAQVALAESNDSVEETDYAVEDVVEEEQCEQVSYFDGVCGTTPLEYSKTAKQTLGAEFYTVHCTITNLDEEAGNFIVQISSLNENDKWIKERREARISANSSETFSVEFNNTSVRPYSCKVLEPFPEKEACEGEIKYREVCR